MIKKFCKVCDKDQWHNPVRVAPKAEPQYRCTSCGEPRRYGQKNSVRIGGKIMQIPKP